MEAARRSSARCRILRAGPPVSLPEPPSLQSQGFRQITPPHAMAKHLDLEEQEQLAEIKHFWNQYGNLISGVVIVVFGAIALWNGWQYWQREQASQAAAMYDEVDRAAQAGDATRVERAFNDVRD